MMGMALYELDIPVVKTSSALTALKKDKVAAGLTTACIRCGRCIDACPSLLVPERLMEASIRNDLDAFEALHGMECVNCGSCSYVCPAKRPLAQSFTATKNALAARNRARAAAAKAEAEAKARAEAEAAAKAEGTDKKGDEK